MWEGDKVSLVTRCSLFMLLMTVRESIMRHDSSLWWIIISLCDSNRPEEQISPYENDYDELNHLFASPRVSHPVFIPLEHQKRSFFSLFSITRSDDDSGRNEWIIWYERRGNPRCNITREPKRTQPRLPSIKSSLMCPILFPSPLLKSPLILALFSLSSPSTLPMMNFAVLHSDILSASLLEVLMVPFHIKM